MNTLQNQYNTADEWLYFVVSNDQLTPTEKHCGHVLRFLKMNGLKLTIKNIKRAMGIKKSVYVIRALRGLSLKAGIQADIQRGKPEKIKLISVAGQTQTEGFEQDNVDLKDPKGVSHKAPKGGLNQVGTELAKVQRFISRRDIPYKTTNTTLEGGAREAPQKENLKNSSPEKTQIDPAEQISAVLAQTAHREPDVKFNQTTAKLELANGYREAIEGECRDFGISFDALILRASGKVYPKDTEIRLKQKIGQEFGYMVTDETARKKTIEAKAKREKAEDNQKHMSPYMRGLYNS